MNFPQQRLRRLRRTPVLRRLVAETRLGVEDLVAPLFVREGIVDPQPIDSLPGIVQHTRSSLRQEVGQLADLGVGAVILFGVPERKDEVGSGASDPNGIVQLAVQDLRDDLGDSVVVMADLCLDEYTDHGHCGLIADDGSVDNDATLERYAEVALAQADAGVDVCAPSGMMDGQVMAIREALDEESFIDVAILAYSAKYASGLYGPFRDAVDVAIADGGDRRGYQQDWHNVRESLNEIRADIGEGADMVMVKPALSYLDVLSRARVEVDVPLAAYHVSGEYAMVKAAAERGWIDGPAVAAEQIGAIKRAGADLVLTYFARELRRGHAVSDVPDTGMKNAELYERGLRRIPGGVNSPVRAFRSVGGTPYFVARGLGSRIWDVEGTELIDYVQSYGASILGHADPTVIETIREAAILGTTFGAPTPGEVRLAEELCSRVPQMEQVRLVSSGTEATMSAVRLARGATGRATVVKFEGNYHGHSDSLLAAAGSGVAEGALDDAAAPDSAGVTAGAVADTRVETYNVVPTLDDTVAVVCVEPVAANMGLVPPVDGFLAGLRAECDRVGALLLFDEVITGFRLGRAGATGWSGVVPDIWCFGKIIGGGLPVGAFGASREIMSSISPLGPVYQAGTLSGNPLATAAGLAVLTQLDAAAYEQLEVTAATLAAGLDSAFSAAGVAAVVPRVGPLVGVFFGDESVFGARRPIDFASAGASVGLGRYPAFFHGMLDRGVAFAPGPWEVAFPSLSHSDDDVRVTVEAAYEVAAAMAG